jgi:thioredoxin reductase
MIENYPGFSDGAAGTLLASQMVSQATKHIKDKPPVIENIYLA